MFFKREKVNSILVCPLPWPVGHSFLFSANASFAVFLPVFTMNIDAVPFPTPAVATAAPFAEDEAKVAVDIHTTRRLEPACDGPESDVSFLHTLLNKGILHLSPAALAPRNTLSNSAFCTQQLTTIILYL